MIFTLVPKKINKKNTDSGGGGRDQLPFALDFSLSSVLKKKVTGTLRKITCFLAQTGETKKISKFNKDLSSNARK